MAMRNTSGGVGQSQLNLQIFHHGFGDLLDGRVSHSFGKWIARFLNIFRIPHLVSTVCLSLDLKFHYMGKAKIKFLNLPLR